MCVCVRVRTGRNTAFFLDGEEDAVTSGAIFLEPIFSGAFFVRVILLGGNFPGGQFSVGQFSVGTIFLGVFF